MIFKRRPDESETVVGLIASALRRDIAFGELEPDRKLKIEELRTRYGGSSHSMREALTQLSAEGLVEAMAQRGFRVASATEDDLRDIVRLRCEIEKLGLSWSLEKGNVAWEGRVIAAHHALNRAREQVVARPLETALEWDEANRLFHASLVEMCDSPRLLTLQAQLYDQSRRFRLAAMREGRIDFAVSAGNHQALVDAVLRRDRDQALDRLQAVIEGNLQHGVPVPVR